MGVDPCISRATSPQRAMLPPGSYLTGSVYNVVLQKSNPAQIRQLILYIDDNRVQVDEVVRELTFAERLHEHFLRDKIDKLALGKHGPVSRQTSPARLGTAEPQALKVKPQILAGDIARNGSCPEPGTRHLLGWCSQFTRIGHDPGGRRPLLRDGGPIIYRARPSAFFRLWN